MSEMFEGWKSLEKVTLNINTDNAINMSKMFYGCSSLKELNLNNFNIDNVFEMSAMFWGCSKELVMKIKTQYRNIKEEAFRNIY